MAALLPRSFSAPVQRQLQSRSPMAVQRHASSTRSPPKPRVLERPEKFTPPSHGQRLRRPTPKHFGPSLSADERTAQRTKQYPRMMPPPGTFMHWFLTNRAIHVYISLSVLFVLGAWGLLLNFKTTSPFAGLLPPASDVFAHPLASARQALDVYKMHAERISEITKEKRRRALEEVQKRRAYRRAHGLERDDSVAAANAVTEGVRGMEAASPVAGAALDEAAYVDFEGRKGAGPPVKRWLGIWS